MPTISGSGDGIGTAFPSPFNLELEGEMKHTREIATKHLNLAAVLTLHMHQAGISVEDEIKTYAYAIGMLLATSPNKDKADELRQFVKDAAEYCENYHKGILSKVSEEKFKDLRPVGGTQ